MNFMLCKNLEILADVEMFDVYLQGTLIQHLKEHLLHGNMNRQDVILYYTTVIIYILKNYVETKRICRNFRAR